MYGIYLLFTLLLLWFCIGGATLAVSRFYPYFPLARSLGLIGFVLVLFFIEHFVGLGSLTWMLPVIVIFSGYMFWRNKDVVVSREFIISEAVFAGAMLYAFFWRFSFPSISPSSERLTDLFFIVNYLDGTTLPPLDHWQPPHAFDYYYGFQHYAAALIGRIFNMSPGETYNFAFAVLGALPLTLVVFAGQKLLRPLQLGRIRYTGLLALLVAAITFGGNGLTPLLKLVFTAPSHEHFVHPSMSSQEKRAAEERYASALEGISRDMIIASARFIGSDRDDINPKDQKVRQWAAGFIFPETKPAFGNNRMVLPSENLGYQYFLGDYHPPLGGYFLLALVLAVMLSLQPEPAPAEQTSSDRNNARISQAILGLSVPLMLITNTWVLPLLVLLIGSWVVFRLISKQTVDWVGLLAGSLGGTFLIYPFLTTFLNSDLSTPIALVNERMHTPVSRFIGMHWPVMLLIAFGLWEGRKRPIAWLFSAVWLVILVLSEVIYIDDPTGGHYSRTNTVMKWWGWMQVGVFVTLGGLLLSSCNRFLRWATASVLLILTLTSGFELQRYWRHAGKHYMGYMEGHRWYTQNSTSRQMFEFLEAAPKGTVLEPVLDNAYSDTSIFSIFNRKPVLLGWPSHLRTWHGNVPRVWILKDEIDSFYRGEMTDALNWLKSNDVRYIVFSNKSDDSAFDAINNQIKSEFVWQQYEHSRRRHTGIWVRIEN